MSQKEIGEAREIRNYLFHLEGSPVKQAIAIQDLLGKGMTQDAIGRLMNWSQGKVSQRLKLLLLHPTLRDRAMKGEIRPTTAYELAGLPRSVQAKYLDKEHVTLREVVEQRHSLALSGKIYELLEKPFENADSQPSLVTCPRCGNRFEP